MTIILPALAVAFAALVVWLVVRIVNRRERWAKWTAIVVSVMVSLPVLYIASFGPVCWIFWSHWCPTELQDAINIAYMPAQRLLEECPEPTRSVLIWYMEIFYPRA